MEVGYTKRASARVIKELLKYEKKVSGNTTFDQAFVKLMTAWELEGGLENKNNQTIFYIYRDGTVIHTFEWSKDDGYIEKERDWNWTFIYKEVLEHIIKTRMWKKPKISKRVQKSIETKKQESTPIEKQINNPYKSTDVETLRKLKNNLSSKISRNKKLGNNATELDSLIRELDIVTQEIKSRN